VTEYIEPHEYGGVVRDVAWGLKNSLTSFRVHTHAFLLPLPQPDPFTPQHRSRNLVLLLECGTAGMAGSVGVLANPPPIHAILQLTPLPAQWLLRQLVAPLAILVAHDFLS
jgi:hypothetical protein